MKVQKEPTIALSMIEVEYMATSHCEKIVWLRQLVADVGYVQEGVTSIMCDNKKMHSTCEEFHAPFLHQTY